MLRSTVSALGVFLVLILMAPALGDDGPRVRYDNHRLVEVTLEAQSDIDTILSISDDPWSDGIGVGTFDFRVAPERMADLEASGLAYRVKIDNIQELIDQEIVRMGGPPRGDWFEDYKSYAEIDSYIDTLIDLRPDLVSRFVFGTSIDGRAMFGMRITSSEGGEDKPAVVFDGTHHAREWITPMTAMFIADRLVRDYETDPEVRQLVDDAVIYVLPLINPDGYEYSRDVDRMWRKNRRDNEGSSCWGVDVNRNYPYGWGGQGSSGDPCSETYRGPEALSEPESTALVDFFIATPNIKGHITFHSYGQLILYPFGHDYVLPPEPDLSAFVELSAGMADAIYSVHGKAYTDQPTYDLYLCSGITSDWVYGDQGILSWTIELRDTGQHGFLLPAEQIIPTGEENFEAAKLLLQYVSVLLRFDFPEGLPTRVDSNTETSVRVDIIPVNGEMEPGSGKLFARIGTSGPFTESSLAPLGGDAYRGTLPAAPCESVIQYYFQVETTGDVVVTSPPDAPNTLYETEVIDVLVFFEDDMETDQGWTVGWPGDDASTGIWNRMDPEGTAAQPEDDHTPAPGTDCYVTDGRGGSLGAYDVDDGRTTLVTPIFDLTGEEDTIIAYWRWYSNDAGNDPHNDIFEVDISDDEGSSWVNAETVGPSGPETSGGWFYHEFRVADFVDLTSQVRVRFVASDENAGSIVEAAVDDFSILEYYCEQTECPGDLNGDGQRDQGDLGILLADWGCTGGNCPGDVDGDGDTDQADLGYFLSVYGVPCP
jgi:murein tripeptide amidase MpaA